MLGVLLDRWKPRRNRDAPNRIDFTTPGARALDRRRRGFHAPRVTANAANVVFVLTTVSSRAEADALAERLVNGRLAACVNQIPGVHSLFRWQGKVDRADEVLLLVKTLETRLEEIKRTLAEIHPYDLPEVVTLRPIDVEEAFARWVGESCAG